MTENLRTCDRCQKRFISEEFESHVCSPYLTSVREILVDYSFNVINENQDKVTVAFGLDNGIVYNFIECKHNPTHRSNPCLKAPKTDAFGHAQNANKTDKDWTEPW